MKKIVLVAIACQIFGAAYATDSDDNNGFLSNYSKLQPAPGNALSRYYIPAGARKKLSTYKSIMVDQPQVFIAKDSLYHGIKPAQINVIAEAFRQQVITALTDDYTVVETAGPGVLYMRLALVDLSIKKDHLHILGYTPSGLIFRAGRKLAQSNYTNAVQHISLLGLSIEGEVRDSESSEVLGEFIDAFGSTSTLETWADLYTEMKKFGTTIKCQMKNGRSSADDHVNCYPAASTDIPGT